MKVKFVPQNIEVEIKPNESVLTVAQDNGIHIQSVCKGIPSCAECRVYIKEGETNVVPPLQPELELIGTAYYIDQRRLSCQLRCFGDVVVDLTEQIEKQHKSTKNPQGRYVKEKEDSHARMGNILEEPGAVKLELTEEDLAWEEEVKSMPSTEPKNSPRTQQSKDRSENRQGQQQRHQNSNRNSQQRSQSQQNAKGRPQGNRNNNPAAKAKDSNQEGGAKPFKNNRNKKRRFNKNNKSGPQSSGNPQGSS